MWHLSVSGLRHDQFTPLLHLLWLCPHKSFKLSFLFFVCRILPYQLKVDATLPTLRPLVAKVLSRRDGILPCKKLIFQYVAVLLAAHDLCLACEEITTPHRLLIVSKHDVVDPDVIRNALGLIRLLTLHPELRVLFLLDQSQGHNVFEWLCPFSSQFVKRIDRTLWSPFLLNQALVFYLVLDLGRN